MGFDIIPFYILPYFKTLIILVKSHWCGFYVRNKRIIFTDPYTDSSIRRKGRDLTQSYDKRTYTHKTH